MEPSAVTVRGASRWMLSHRCTRCGRLRMNRTAADDSPEQLRAMLDAAVAQSRRNIDEALAAGGRDQQSVGLSRKENRQCSRHAILMHLMQETARHNCPADFMLAANHGAPGR